MRKKKELKIVNPLEEEELAWGNAWQALTKLSPKHQFSINELRRLLKYKYKNITNFCKLSGYSKSKLHCLLYGRVGEDDIESRLNEVVELIHKTDNSTIPKYPVLDYDTRVFLKMRLYNKFQNVEKFCIKFPEFTPGYLAHVFRGRKKYQCPKIQRLAQILNTAYLQGTDN